MQRPLIDIAVHSHKGTALRQVLIVKNKIRWITRVCFVDDCIWQNEKKNSPFWKHVANVVANVAYPMFHYVTFLQSSPGIEPLNSFYNSLSSGKVVSVTTIATKNALKKRKCMQCFFLNFIA